jgi:hypothetical protein
LWAFGGSVMANEKTATEVINFSNSKLSKKDSEDLKEIAKRFKNELMKSIANRIGELIKQERLRNYDRKQNTV